VVKECGARPYRNGPLQVVESAASTARPWPVALAWIAAVAFLATGARAPVPAQVYIAADFAALVVALGAIVRWAGERRLPGIEHVALLLIAAVHGVALFVVWLGDGFQRWEVILGAYLGLYTLLIVLQGGALWLSWASRSSR
jgi:hypothetical protein